jgi:hypothetical protein
MQKRGEHVRSVEGAYIRRQGTGTLTTVASSPSVVGYPGKHKPSSVATAGKLSPLSTAASS